MLQLPFQNDSVNAEEKASEKKSNWLWVSRRLVHTHLSIRLSQTRSTDTWKLPNDWMCEEEKIKGKKKHSKNRAYIRWQHCGILHDKLCEVSNRVNTSVTSAYTCFYSILGRSLTRMTYLLACSAWDACPLERERERERKLVSYISDLLVRNRYDVRSNWETTREREREWETANGGINFR